MKTRKWFTLVELLVVLTIVMVLASIMMHCFVRAKEIARRAYCLNNLRQISVTANLYNVDRGNLPYSQHWLVDFSFAADYLPSYGVMECPSMDDTVQTANDLNGNTSYHYMCSKEDWERNNLSSGDGTEYGFDASNPSILSMLSSRNEKVIYDKTDAVHAGIFNVVFMETSNAGSVSSFEANDYWFLNETGSLNFPDGISVASSASSAAVAQVADSSSTSSGNGNNGHGNNADGVDSSNPGQGHGGPNGAVDPSGTVDDETNGSGTTTASTTSSSTTTTTTVASSDTGHSNNGHGNNADGVDSSNPGQGHGGPNGAVDPSGTVDDETNGGSTTTSTTTTTTTTDTSGTTTTTSTTGNSGNGNSGNGNSGKKK